MMAKETRPTPEASGATPAPEAPAPSFEDTVLSLLGQMTDQVRSLADRVQAVEDRAPRFVRATPETYGNPGEQQDLLRAASPDGIPRSQTVPVFPDGQKVPDFLLKQYPPRFGSGQRVRLNPDAVPHGRVDGKTRGDLMADAGVPSGVGEVIDRVHLDSRGVWKYRVRFPGQTLPGSNGGLVALHEPELLPA